MTGKKHYAHLRYGMLEEESDGYIALNIDAEERLRQCGKSYKKNAHSDFEREQHNKYALQLAEIFKSRKFPNPRKDACEAEAYRVSLIRIYEKEAK